MRSKNGCFAARAKRMGQDPELMKTPGEERQRLLELYAVWQSRYGCNAKKVTASENVEVDKSQDH